MTWGRILCFIGLHDPRNYEHIVKNSWGYRFGCRECGRYWTFAHGTERGTYETSILHREWLP